jgi:dTDP-4-amino-4,6-dideoxygalactose transaminase
LIAGARALTGEDSAEIVVGLLREKYGARGILLTDSGTSALAVAIRSCSQGAKGLPVALPAYCCYDLASAALAANVPVVFYDLDPSTLAPDETTLTSTLARGVSAIVWAHLYGMPVDPGLIKELASRRGTILIEDAAQGIGVEIHEHPAGSLASLSVLSFGRGKGLTGGSGGALLANDQQGLEALESAGTLRPAHNALGDLGRVVAQHAFGRPALYGLLRSLPFLHLGETVFHEPRMPTRPTPVSLAILAATWDASWREAEVRRRHGARLSAALKYCDRFEPLLPPSGSRPGYLRLPVLHRGARPMTTSARHLGIGPSYPLTLNELPSIVDRIAWPVESTQGAAELVRRLVTLPTHSLLQERDLRDLERWIAPARSSWLEPE